MDRFVPNPSESVYAHQIRCFIPELFDKWQFRGEHVIEYSD